MYCKWGFKKNRYGCSICKCKRPPIAWVIKEFVKKFGYNVDIEKLTKCVKKAIIYKKKKVWFWKKEGVWRHWSGKGKPPKGAEVYNRKKHGYIKGLE